MLYFKEQENRARKREINKKTQSEREGSKLFMIK